MMRKNNEFFELLCLNSKDELRKFLLENGKGPKPKCPVQFVKENNEDGLYQGKVQFSESDIHS